MKNDKKAEEKKLQKEKYNEKATKEKAEIKKHLDTIANSLFKKRNKKSENDDEDKKIG